MPLQASTALTPTLNTLHRCFSMASPSNLRHHRGRQVFDLPSCFTLAVCNSRHDSQAGFAADGQLSLDIKTYSNDDQMQ